MPSSCSTQTANFYSANLGTSIVFPTGTIVPSWIGYTTNSDWDVYTAGSGRAVMGTTNSSLLNTVANGTPASYTATLSFTGPHTGTTSSGRATSTTGTTAHQNLANPSVGNHNHTASETFATSAFSPTRLITQLIRSNKPVTTLPPNTIGFRDNTRGNYGTKLSFSPSGSPARFRHIVHSTSPGNTVVSGIETVSSGRSTSTSGVHLHTVSNRTLTTGTAGSANRQVAGDHSHFLSYQLTQSYAGPARVLHAWTSSLSRVPETDVVVMYNGNLADLPTGWFLCNGSNGTLNMDAFYVVYDSNVTVAAWGTVLASSLTVNSMSVPTFSNSHNHIAGLNSTSGLNANHLSFTWSHSHTITSTTTTPYTIDRVFLYFIQYKG
jgi:hypothetical protein